MAKLPRNLTLVKPGIQNYCYTLEDGTRVNPAFKDCVLPNILGKGSTCTHDLLKEAFNLAADRPFLGTHASPTEHYVWKTYAETYDTLKHFGSGLHTFHSLGNGEPFKCVGIYGKNRPEWLISQYACISYQLVTVPLYDTLGDEALLYICNQAELSVVVCDTAERALKLLNLTDTVPFLKHLIIMNEADDLTEIKSKVGNSVQILTFNDVVALGKANPKETMPSGPDDLVLICYTSGTTGLPKGVMVPNKMFLASLNNNILNSGRDVFTEDDVYLSYLPMAHIFEQMFILLTIFNHGRIGFYSGDPRLLSDDAKMLKPTIWTVVPRILLRIYEGVQKKIGNSKFKKWMLEKALETKLKDIDRGILSKNTFWDVIFFSKVRALFGDSIRVIICGGAPLSTEVLRFARAAFSCWIMEGYGSTETASSLSTSFASDIDGGHVGAPVPGLLVRLVDIPDMGIVAARDNKGEICVKGPSCTPGYYKSPELTAALFDSEGWLHTGDVAIWTEQNSLKIVDRCKHIFKLSQGEYVAPEKIEAIYTGSGLVAQVFVDGDAQQAYPVAIIVPEVDCLVEHLNTKVANGKAPVPTANGQTPVANGDVNAAGEHPTVKSVEHRVHGKAMTVDQLCQYAPAIKAVLDDVVKKGKQKGLKGFEQVRAIHLTSTPFTIENGMLTPTLKAARGAIRRQFQDVIRELYIDTNAALSSSNPATSAGATKTA